MTHLIILGIRMTFRITCGSLRANEDANVVEGHWDDILIRTWLIHQADLHFLNSPLLKKVMAWCRLTFMQVSVNFVWIMLAVDMLQHEDLMFNVSDLLYVYSVVRPYTNNQYL